MKNITKKFKNNPIAYQRPVIYKLTMEVDAPYGNSKTQTRKTVYSYIGQTENARRRFTQHINNLSANNGKGIPFFQDAFNKGAKLNIYIEDINPLLLKQSGLTLQEYLILKESYYISITNCQNVRNSGLDFLAANINIILDEELEYIPAANIVYRNFINGPGGLNSKGKKKESVQHVFILPELKELNLSSQINNDTYIKILLPHSHKNIIHKTDPFMNIYLDKQYVYIKNNIAVKNGKSKLSQKILFKKFTAWQFKAIGYPHHIIPFLNRRNVSIAQAVIALSSLNKTLIVNKKFPGKIFPNHSDIRLKNINVKLLNTHFK